MKFAYPPDSKPVDGYTIRRGLHRGGFGEVYYAISAAGKEVALKLLTHDLETELRGIRQCLNLKHPNLVTIFDVKTDAQGDTWVVMEYVSGASLDDVLNAFPNGLPIEEVRDWMAGMLAGTEYLHSRGIVHRDLKPANIYRENGVVKIGDVGLSKQLGGTRRQHTEAVGTVYYMAPEVAHGQYGAEVDVYGLGVILYEMLTGKLPFDGETTGEILMKHLTATPDLSRLPSELRSVVAHALEKDPAKRIRSAREFAQELQRGLKFEPIPESAFEPGSTGSAAPQAVPTAKSPEVNGPANRQTSSTPQSGRRESRWHRRQSPASPGHVAHQYVESVVNRVRGHVHRQLERAAEKEERRRARRLRRTEAAALRAEKRKQAPSRSGSAFKSNINWWILVGIAVVLFAPWQMVGQGDTAEALGIMFLLGGGLLAIHYLTLQWRPASPVADPLVEAVVVPPKPPVSLWESLSLATLQATFTACLLMAAGIVVMFQYEPTLASLHLNDFVWVIAAAGIGATLVVLVHAWSHRRIAPDETAPQWLPTAWKMAAVGALLGVTVAGLGEFLEVRETLSGPARPLFRSIGVHRLEAEGHPTLPAYVIFFAVTLWLQRWDKVLDQERVYRVRVGPVAWAALFGWLVAGFTGIPVTYGVLWSLAITTGAQLAAPWRPRTLAA